MAKYIQAIKGIIKQEQLKKQKKHEEFIGFFKNNFAIDKDGFLRKIKGLQNEIKEHLTIKDSGLTVHTKGQLSKGCQCCKSGTWMCIYVGHFCNLSCYYCPQNNLGRKDHPEAFMSGWVDDMKTYIDMFAKDNVKGISYSGGEPFKYLDKVYKFAKFVTEKHPDIYQWIYTNGLLANSENMRKLADLGIDEIRFHLLATGFSKEVMNKLPIARKIFKKVTVEIPSLQESYHYLIKNKLIFKLDDYGVDQLNLAEMYLTEANFNAFNKTNLEFYKYDSIFYVGISPQISRLTTYAIIKYAIENNIKMTINDCSNDAKQLQIVKKKMNPLLRNFL